MMVPPTAAVESLDKAGELMMNSMNKSPCVAVVIPAFRVSRQVLGVISQIGEEVRRIYVIDDACPEGSGDLVQAQCRDPRVSVLRHEVNGGVGAAVITGYRAALQDGADIIVKVDGDGQMDPALLADFVAPIAAGQADYTKGNRFFNLEGLERMPRTRLIGNAILSFMNKVSSGYWDIFDPTNGYTAVHAKILRWLPLEKIDRGYLFETDMLFRLNVLRAVVWDVPMQARYGDEVSSMNISRTAGKLFVKHIRNFVKRIFYNYYLRDVSIASIELPLGLLGVVAGSLLGSYHWIHSARLGVTTPAGTVMLATIPLLAGLQLLLAFIHYDIAAVPRRTLHLSMGAAGRLT
jgi:glycosyltransferase involved in cell wall biosynthesis